MAYDTTVQFKLEYTVKRVIRRFYSGIVFTEIKCNNVEGYKKRGFPKEITAFGFFPVINEGDTFLSDAMFKEDKSYGYSISLLGTPKIVRPSSANEVALYLKTRVSGIGNKSAEYIVETLGVSCISEIQKNPSLINQLRNLTGSQKKNLLQFCTDNCYFEDLLLFLAEIGVSTSYGVEIYERLGTTSIQQIYDNPYLLTSVTKMSFSKLDKIANKLGLPWNNPVRLESAILSTIKNQMFLTGNTCVEYSTFYQLLKSFLSFSKAYPVQEFVYEDGFATPDILIREFTQEEVKDAIQRLIESGDLVIYDRYLYLKNVFTIETESARLTKRFINSNPTLEVAPSKIQEFLNKTFTKLSSEQKEAVVTCLTSSLSILTGGPGVGKTYTMNSIIKTIKHFSPKSTITLLAPTAKAAARMREVTAENAETIHSKLKILPGDFSNNDYVLESDFVIIDEASMIGARLYREILNKVSPSASIILIGDHAQLPSVEYGNVLKELISSNVVPVASLTKIFRQSEQSHIVQNAHKIRSGLYSECNSITTGNDFVFGEIPNTVNQEQDVCDAITNLVCTLVKKGMELKDILVLTPIHGSFCGTMSLNTALQNALNPDTNLVYHYDGLFEFRINDRVIHVKNNKNLGVKNGDLGTVCEIKDGEYLKVQFDFLDEPVTYTENDLEELKLAYAITVHKSQGSEADVVIMPFVNSTKHKRMLKNNLIYTGITRAKKKFYGLGSFATLKNQSILLETDNRISLLGHFLSSLS